MISIVVTTIVITIIAQGLVTAIGIAAVVSLGIFLGAKELVRVNHLASSTRISQLLNVGVLPLAIAFGVLIAT
ncbi:MAG: hypothetical protein J7K77_02690 [Dehalococcoidales bacterium]|nr:hypothetical protein [Dehalococcoidales bacterium]